MFCLKCGEPIALLGLLDRETKCKQFACTKCLTVYLQNNNGLIFPKDELRTYGEEDELP